MRVRPFAFARSAKGLFGLVSLNLLQGIAVARLGASV
jgi:hypothetical protein